MTTEVVLPVRKPLVRRFREEDWPKVAILGCAFVYGSNFAVVKTLDAAMCPSLSASLRFGLASAASVPILKRYGKTSKLNRVFWTGAVEAGCVNGLGYVLQAVGLDAVDASVSAFACSLAVVVVPALDALILKKRTSKATWVGAAVATLGVALLSFDSSGPPANLDEFHRNIGYVATALQPLCFGYGFWRTEQILTSTLGDPEQKSLFVGDDEKNSLRVASDEKSSLLVGSSLCCAAAQLFAVKAISDLWLSADLLHGNIAINLPAMMTFFGTDRGNVIAAIAWTGLITTFLTVLVETLALSKISAKDASLLFTTEPIFGAAFASVTLHEHFGRISLIGASLVVASLASAALASEEKA